MQQSRPKLKKKGNPFQYLDNRINYQLQFVGQADKPDSIIALKPLSQVIPLQTTHMIFLICEQDKYDQMSNYICRIPNLKPILVCKYQKAKDQIDKLSSQNNQAEIQIWCVSVQMLIKVSEAKWIKPQWQIIFFNHYENASDLKQFQEKKRKKQWKQNVLSFPKQISELRKRHNSKIALPNILSFSTNKKQTNLQKMIFSAMLKQQSDLQMLCVHLYRFIQIKYPKNNKDELMQFFEKYQNNRSQVIIQAYTKEGFFYKFLNNLLRTCFDPLQLFYVQPIIKDMFNEIKRLYIKQTQKKPITRRQYYRGALVSQEQLQFYRQNQGGLIYTLGFLSTSARRMEAERFIINAFITIIVEHYDKSDSGFADISDKSNQQQQQEVLFNLLNYFIVGPIQYSNNIHYIELYYGRVPKIVEKIKNKEQLSKQEQKIQALLKYQQTLKQINLQSEIFFISGNYSAAVDYWSQKTEYMKKKLQFQDIIGVKVQLIKSHYLSSQYDVVIRMFNQNEELKQNLSVLKWLGESYLKEGDKNKGQSILIQLLQRAEKSNINGCNTAFVIQVMQSLSSLYFNIDESNQARKYSDMAVKKAESFYDEKDYRYISQKFKNISLNVNIEQSSMFRREMKQLIQKQMINIQGIEGRQLSIFVYLHIVVALFQSAQLKSKLVKEKGYQGEQIKRQGYNKIQGLMQQAERLYSIVKGSFSAYQNAQFFQLKAKILDNVDFEKVIYIKQAYQSSLRYYKTIENIDELKLAEIYTLLGLFLAKKIKQQQKQAVRYFQLAIQIFKSHDNAPQDFFSFAVLKLAQIYQIYPASKSKSVMLYEKFFDINKHKNKRSQYKQLRQEVQKFKTSLEGSVNNREQIEIYENKYQCQHKEQQQSNNLKQLPSQIKQEKRISQASTVQSSFKSQLRDEQNQFQNQLNQCVKCIKKQEVEHQQSQALSQSAEGLEKQSEEQNLQKESYSFINFGKQNCSICTHQYFIQNHIDNEPNPLQQIVLIMREALNFRNTNMQLSKVYIDSSFQISIKNKNLIPQQLAKTVQSYHKQINDGFDEWLRRKYQSQNSQIFFDHH